MIIVSTGIGLLISTFTQTQIAARLVAAFALTLVPSVRLSRASLPAGDLRCTGGAAVMSRHLPGHRYCLSISVGTFTKGTGFPELLPDYFFPHPHPCHPHTGPDGPVSLWKQ
ncbi:MAG: hypothetical protein MZV49_15445 [Rhodopseudomonas palustris]|nr:hypothetical protein [Rhodopseudomonas palustris]